MLNCFLPAAKEPECSMSLPVGRCRNCSLEASSPRGYPIGYSRVRYQPPCRRVRQRRRKEGNGRRTLFSARPSQGFVSRRLRFCHQLAISPSPRRTRRPNIPNNSRQIRSSRNSHTRPIPQQIRLPFRLLRNPIHFALRCRSRRRSALGRRSLHPRRSAGLGLSRGSPRISRHPQMAFSLPARMEQ